MKDAAFVLNFILLILNSYFYLLAYLIAHGQNFTTH